MHNSHEPDLTWQEMTDLSPEDEIEGGPEIYYFTVEDSNIHSREFLAEELIPDESKVEGSPTRKTKRETPKTEARSHRHNQPRPAKRIPAASNATGTEVRGAP